MSEKLATISGSDNAIRRLFDETTLAGKSDYEDAYVNISDGELNIMTAVSGSKVAAYSTFHESDFLQTIEVSDAVRENTPEGENPTVQALIKIGKFGEYFDLVSGGDGNIRIEFHGELEDELATTMEMYAGLNAGVYLPTSDSIYEKMPLWLPEKFNEDNVWSTDEATFDTHIRTNVDTIKRIITAVDSDDVTGMDNYPIVVDDGVFKLDVTDRNQRNWVSGSLDSGSDVVQGDDVANLYGRGFKPIFETLSGEVLLQTTEGGAPLVVIKEMGNGVIRHMVGATGSL